MAFVASMTSIYSSRSTRLPFCHGILLCMHFGSCCCRCPRLEFRHYVITAHYAAARFFILNSYFGCNFASISPRHFTD